MSVRLDDRRVTFRDPVTGEWRTIHTLSALGRAAEQAAAGWPGAAAAVEHYCRSEQRMLAIARIRCDRVLQRAILARGSAQGTADTLAAGVDRDLRWSSL